MSETTNNTFLTFMLGDVTYAVDVCSVREILSCETITAVPRTAPYLKGVMNIRGTVISVIDLRILFGMEITKKDEESSIIVSEINIPGEPEMIFGFIADDVESVIGLDSIIDAGGSASLDMMHNEFIKQVGRFGDKFVLILDIPKIITSIENENNEKKEF